MLRIKKYQVLIVAIIVTSLFLVFQLLFVHDLRKSISAFSSEQILLNPKIDKVQKLKKQFENQISLTSNSFVPTKQLKPIKRVKATEILIPLEPNNQPKLFYILPFYHRKNFFNFSLVEVFYSHFSSKYEQEHKPSEFVNIELENRVIDRNKLKSNYEYRDDNFYLSIKGINKQKFEFYKPDSNGYFKCLNSNQKIPYQNLNDDFCDCVDGSDEPGTSACQFNVFYCSTQNEYLNDNFIPSSKVDDKICDCCDGSDESIVKCQNTCEQKIAILKEESDKNKKAIIEKRKYLVDGVFKDEQVYGPKGVFFKLSQKCFQIDWSEYTFEVCPYSKVSQFKKNEKSSAKNIGQKASLIMSEKENKKHWILKMENGDSNFCPQPRESEIHFDCGLSDELKSVQEPQKCLYVFHLQTPAAC